MKTLKKLVLNNCQELSDSEMKNILAGVDFKPGTCAVMLPGHHNHGSYNSSSGGYGGYGTFITNPETGEKYTVTKGISKEDAVREATTYSGWWCCDSCSSTWWYLIGE